MDTEQLMMKKSLYEGETWLGKPPEIEESRIEKTMEADVVVVGAGLAGVAAARAAAELGSTVLLLEKCEAPQARSGDFAVMDSRVADVWGRRNVEKVQIVNDLIDQQLNDYPDEDIKATQERLNAAYDAFTAKYGLLNDRKNGRLFEQDSSYYLLCSLENLDEQGQLKSKAAMFTKRTIRPERTVTSVDTPSEALAVSIGEHGKVDLPYMAELLGTPGEYGRITTELSGVIFKDAAGQPVGAGRASPALRRPHRPGSGLADGRRVPVRRCPGKAADGAVCCRDQPGICGQCGCADQSAAQRTGSI